MGSLGEGRAYATGSEERVEELRMENINKRPPVCNLVYSCPPVTYSLISPYPVLCLLS
jgi:hypothetical protein